MVVTNSFSGNRGAPGCHSPMNVSFLLPIFAPPNRGLPRTAGASYTYRY